MYTDSRITVTVWQCFPKVRQASNLRVQILKTEAAPLINKGHTRN